MPLYEYELCEGDCKVCGGKFTLRRPLSAKPLDELPGLQKAVRKIISSFNSPHKLKPLSISDAKKAGLPCSKKSARANTNGSKSILTQVMICGRVMVEWISALFIFKIVTVFGACGSDDGAIR